MGPVETEFATITVREARSDGYGVYLAVAFTPKEKDVLAYNWSVDPNTDGPETMGIEPDRPGQTLAEWAAGHGYRQLMRVSVISMGNGQKPPEDIQTNEEYAAWMDEQGISYRITGNGGLMIDPLYSGPDFDSMVNDKSLLEEDGSTLVMAAGICLAGQDEYEVDWTACPAKMNKYGRIETGMAGMHSYENWSQDDFFPGESGGAPAVYGTVYPDRTERLLPDPVYGAGQILLGSDAGQRSGGSENKRVGMALCAIRYLFLCGPGGGRGAGIHTWLPVSGGAAGPDTGALVQPGSICFI